MSKAKKAVQLVALTTIVLVPGSPGAAPGSMVSVEDPAEAERLVEAGRAAWPKDSPKPAVKQTAVRNLAEGAAPDDEAAV